MKGDFLGFTFDGKHSQDYGIVRVSAGDRLSSSAFANITDKIVSVPGKIGVYYFGTEIGVKNILMNFAFDSMTEKQFNSFPKWVSGEKLGRLIFDEHPYKFYLAKVSAPVEPTFIPFEVEGTKQITNVYKGEGQLRFTAFSPLAHAVDLDLTSYKDIFNNKYDLEYLPAWFYAAELIPLCNLNRNKPILPALENYFYVGGMKEVNFDLEIVFNTKEEIIEAIQGDIQALQKAVEDLTAEINGKVSESQQYIQKINEINEQKQSYNTIILNKTKQLEENNNYIKMAIERVPEIQKEKEQIENEIANLDLLISTKQGEIDNITKSIEELNKTLDELLAIENPNYSQLRQIERLQKEIASQEGILSEKETEMEELNSQKSQKEEEYAGKEEEEQTLEENKILKEQENITLQNDIASAEERIAELDQELIIPTEKVEELNNEITELTEQKTEIEIQIQVLSTEGLPLDGEELIFTKEAQIRDGEVIHPEKKCTIKLDNILKGKTMKIKASNNDVAYYDEDGTRFDYFDGKNGDFITAEPNGIYEIYRGIFNADSSLSNKIELVTELSEEEKQKLIGKPIVFKEGSKVGGEIEYSNSTIINIEENNLILSNGYTLTTGEANFIVLNDLVKITLNDTKFVKKVTYSFPYIYY